MVRTAASKAAAGLVLLALLATILTAGKLMGGSPARYTSTTTSREA